MRLVSGWETIGDALTNKNFPAGGVHRAEAIRGAGRITGDPVNRRHEILVGGRIVLGRSEFCEVVMIDGVSQVKIAVLAKVGMKGKTEQAEVAPASDLLANV